MSFTLLMADLRYVVAAVLLVLLAVTMYVKRLNHSAPLFFAYVVYASLSMSIIDLLGSIPNPYLKWYASWIDEGICILIEFAILSEIFGHLFAPYEGIRRFAKLTLLWSAVALMAVASITAVFFHQVAYSIPILSVFLVVDRSLRVVQLGLILSLFALSTYLHLRWKNFTFGVALGFGFYALMMLTSRVLRMFYGRLVAAGMNSLEALAYFAAIGIWCWYAFQPDIANVPIVSLPSSDLERWDRSLLQLLGPNTTSSSIPEATKQNS